jgi:hypothetical protein
MKVTGERKRRDGTDGQRRNSYSGPLARSQV